MVTEKWTQEENFNISEPFSLRNAAAGSARNQISVTFFGANKMTNTAESGIQSLHKKKQPTNSR